MPLRSDWSTDACPIARGIDAIGDPWVLLILREALTGATRFDELKDRLGIADNILSARLKAMVNAGLLRKKQTRGQGRPTSHYELTAAGADALPVLHAYAQWAHVHTPSTTDHRLGVQCRACGVETSPGEVCEQCGARLEPGSVTWQRPGSRWQGTSVDLVDPGVTAAAR